MPRPNPIAMRFEVELPSFGTYLSRYSTTPAGIGCPKLRLSTTPITKIDTRNTSTS
jgi:hypothetical protein